MDAPTYVSRFVAVASAASGVLLVAAPALRAGPPSSPDWIGELDIPHLQFGSDACAAGDVNGDGYGDALVTSPHYGDSGAAFVFFGSPSGLSTTPNWQKEDSTDGAQFGISGSTAGDVNGDGYDDIIVGSWGHTNPEILEGAAFAYYGGPSGPSPVADWMFESDNPEAELGESVGAAGDVNGDGYDDVIVGALDYSGGHSEEGKAYVFFGSPEGLLPTPGWTYESNATNYHAGGSVYGAGDVNGDGYDDILVSRSGGCAGGCVLLFLGSPTGPSSSPDWIGSIGQSGAGFGNEVGPAGDVNGDGYADVVIGARFYDGGQVDEGAVFLYYGSASGLSATPDWTKEGNRADSTYGDAVRTAGDVNGDGYADIIIGDRAYHASYSYGGLAQLFYGGPDGPGTISGWNGFGSAANDYYGHSVSGVGDVNGDGRSDIIVTATGADDGEFNEGLAFVYYGRPDIPIPYPPKWTLDATVLDEGVGSMVNHVGDVNGDGLGDVVIAAELRSGAEAYMGRVTVCLGDPSGTPVVNAIIDGTQGLELLGHSADGAGDVNGDGYADLAIGHPLFDGAGRTDNGKVTVYHGSPTGISPSPDWEVLGAADGEYQGTWVADAGDVDGDGYDDLLTCASYYSNGQSHEGIAYLYAGSASGLSASPTWSWEPNFTEARLGKVQGVGDLNGDGYDDITVGVGGFNDSHSQEGAVFLFYGSATGPSPTPDLYWTSNQLGAWMEVAARGGDLNGDGYDDLILACDNKNGGGEVLNGRIWIHYGSPSGVGATADAEILGLTHNENFGYSVDGAGDVNGDGYGDLIAGGLYYDGSFDNQGIIRIYLGSATGLDLTPAFSTVTERDGSELGRAVSTAGDLNGDGFADVLAGAPRYDVLGGADGRAFLYLGGSYYGREGGVSWRPRQTRIDGTPLPLRGTTPDGDRMQLHVDARSPMGRVTAEVEWQMVEDGTDIAAGPVVTEPSVDTGSPSAIGSVMPVAVDVVGLTPATAYQWRLRLRVDSPFAPSTRWMSVGPAVPSMEHFVTGSEVLSAEAPGAVDRGRLSVRPNPVRSSATISYTLTTPGMVTVSIVDVAGREVARLDRDVRLPGTHTVSWDGRAGTASAPNGVYFARVETPSGTFVEKLVRLQR